MFETDAGQKLPVIFPEALTHSIVALCMAEAIEACLKGKARAVSAGYVDVPRATTHGNSESLGLDSQTADSVRITIGDSIAFMPDEMIVPLMKKMMEAKSSE